MLDCTQTQYKVRFTGYLARERVLIMKDKTQIKEHGSGNHVAVHLLLLLLSSKQQLEKSVRNLDANKLDYHRPAYLMFINDCF